MIALYPYNPPSFLTLLGSLSAVRRLKKRGFPEHLRNWRFVTLTIDREEYPDPAEAYDVGTRHLRQFVYELKARGYSISRWCWKLEFHQPDDRTGEIYPHWHLLFDYKRPIPCELITELWGKGRTEIKGVRDDGFNYLFKYVGKSVSGLPDWILTRFRVRLFQTSKGFFPAGCTPAKTNKGPSPRLAADPSDGNTENDWREVAPGIVVREVPDRTRDEVATIGERLNRWARSVVSRSESIAGEPARYRLHIGVGESWGDVLVSAARHKLSQKLGNSELNITANRIHSTCPKFLPKNLLVYQTAYSL